MADDLLVAYQRDHSPQAFTRLVENYTPLVRSVCRRYLYQAQDQDDAIQITFTKLAHHAPGIHGSVKSWLARTAYSTSIDLIRRALREKGTVGEYGWMSRVRAGPAPGNDDLPTAIWQRRLEEAIAELDEGTQRLIRERFYHGLPLRSMAQKRDQSVATTSRRIHEAIGLLSDILREMERHDGRAETADDPGRGQACAQGYCDGSDGMRFAPDWRAGLAGGKRPRAHDHPPVCLPGWTRPVRVGVMVSYGTILRPTSQGIWMGIEGQLRAARMLVNPAFELVGMVEPGTQGQPSVERMVRDYELTAGLIDATDENALRTLDVIVWGMNYHLQERMLDAVAGAVRRGVGFYKEWWMGDGYLRHDPRRRTLLLADSPIGIYHTQPYHDMPMPATVVNTHELLPGLAAGTSLLVGGCGPVYRPVPEASVLVVKDRLIEAHEQSMPEIGPTYMPVMLAGPSGQGRVVAVHLYRNEPLACHPRLAGDYMTNIVTWLAEPRRE